MRAVVAEGRFVRLLLFRVLVVLTYQMVTVTVGWHLYQLTHDPLSLGLVGLAEVVPYFLFALVAGYAIDRYSRKLFGVLASLLLVCNSLLLAAISSGVFPGDPTLLIYAAMAVGGFARAFINPSYNALFALILPREKFARAAGVGSSVFQFGLIGGPALGGLVVGYFGKTSSYLMAALFALGGALALLSLQAKEPPRQSGNMPVLRSMAEGLRFVFSNQIVLGAQSLDMFAVLFGGAVSMLPAFIHDIYHYGPEGLGILRAAPAIGGMVTGLILARHPVRFNNGRWLLASVAAFGVTMIVFALLTDFWGAALVLLLSGVCDGVSVVTRVTIMQLATPDALRGRVSAVNGIFIGTSNELGALESGVAARLMGLVPSVVFGGLMTLAVVGATALLAPKLRKLELDHLEQV